MSAWHQFIKELNVGNNAPYSDEDNPHQLILLDQYALIIIQGPDAKRFLQGQCTCDFDLLEQGQWVQGAHCNPKGRMISSFVGAKLGTDKIGLRVHKSLAQSALEALKRYIVFSKASIEHLDGMALFIHQGPATQALNLKAKTTQAIQGGTVLCHEEACYEFWLPSDAAISYINKYHETHSIHPHSVWVQHLIQHGIGEVHAEQQEAYIPQHFNYDLTEAISFTKGCYTGQEIIARMKYKGTVKKRLFCGRMPYTDTLPQDAAIETKDGTLAGQLIMYTQTSNSTVFLALLNVNEKDNNTLRFISHKDTKIQWLDLPYAIS